jgi:ABC-2 type transport system permease protein
MSAYEAAGAWPVEHGRSLGAVTVARVELRKLLAQAPARVALAVCALAPLGFVGVLQAQQAVPADTLFGRWVHSSGFAVPLVILGFSGSWGFPVLAGLVGGDLFAGEDRHDTWKTLLTRSRGRFELFAGKVIAAGVLAVVCVTVLAVSGVAAGLLVVGRQPLVGLSGTTIPAGHALGLVVESWALALAPVLGFTSIAILLSVATRSGIAGVLGPALLGLAMQLLALVGDGETVRTLLLGSSFDAWHGLFTAHPYDGPAEQALIVSATYVVVCLGAAWALLRRRNFAGAASDSRPRWIVWIAAAAAVLGVLTYASGLGPASVTAGRLEAAIGPTFANLVALQQRLLGHKVPAGASLKVLSTCYRRGSSTPYRGAGPDWLCTLSLVSLSTARQLPVNYDVEVRANGCYTADGPASIGGATLRGKSNEPNPLYAFDGCFQT